MQQSQSPEIGVGIAITENDKILPTRRRDYPVWCIPGGHISPGESVIDAAIREAREETGLSVQITSFVGLYSLPHKWQQGSCEIIVRGTISGGKLVRVTDETLDAQYFSLDELPADLVGWMFHEAVDALSSRTGVLAVLDTHLSIRQSRERAGAANATNDTASQQWLKRLCEHPNRIDLSGVNQSTAS
jgi:ADP-ribose pyrophosphatase YjhB (NUDIX family)